MYTLPPVSPLPSVSSPHRCLPFRCPLPVLSSRRRRAATVRGAQPRVYLPSGIPRVTVTLPLPPLTPYPYPLSCSPLPGIIFQAAPCSYDPLRSTSGLSPLRYMPSRVTAWPLHDIANTNIV